MRHRIFLIALFAVGVVVVVLTLPRMLPLYRSTNVNEVAAFFTYLYTILTLFLLFMILWGGYLAHEQLKELTKATHAQSFFSAADRLQKEQLRSDRNRLFKLRDDEKGLDQWDQEAKDAVGRVCHNYDVVGIMVRNGMLPKEIIIDSWGNSLFESWAAAELFVKDLRDNQRGRNFWDDFEWLANKAAQWAKDHETYNPKGERAKELWGEAKFK